MMGGLELVRQTVVERLREQGVQAEAAYSRNWAGKYTGAVVVVGVRSCAGDEAGLGGYLGERWDEESGTVREIYGRRAELVLSLDAYAPRSAGAAACLAALERAQDVLTREMPAGLRPGTVQWDAVGFDRDTEMFLQRGSLTCGAYFLAETEAETGLLLRFKLKGVPWIEHDGT